MKNHDMPQEVQLINTNAWNNLLYYLGLKGKSLLTAVVDPRLTSTDD